MPKLILNIVAFFAFSLQAQSYEYNLWHDNKRDLHLKWNVDTVVNSWSFQLLKYITNRDTLKDKDPFAYSRSYLNYSSISDTSGNLLFYTDNDTIYDGIGLPLKNGNLKVSENDEIDRSVFIRMPGQYRYYYLFYDCIRRNQFYFPTSGGFYYAIIDRYHWSGMPSVLVKNKLLYMQDVRKQDVSFKAYYGRTRDTINIDLIVDGADSIHSFILSNNFISRVASVKIMTDTFLIGGGYLRNKLSTTLNGEKKLLNNYGKRIASILPDNYLIVKNNRLMTSEFAPNGRFVYCLIEEPSICKIIQYDLVVKNKFGRYDSVILYQSEDLFNSSDMILGPDYKIYFCGKSTISVIEYPDQKGLRCSLRINKYSYNISQTGPFLGLHYSHSALPYMANMKAKLLSNSIYCQSKLGIVRLQSGYNDSSILSVCNKKYYSDSNIFHIEPLDFGYLPVMVRYKANDTWLTFNDTIFVKENKRISISGNPIICGSTPARLSVSDSFGSFKWSNGDSTKNIAVSRPFTAFIFIPDSVCAHSDTVEVFKVSRKNYIEQSREGICENDSVVISLSPSSNLAFITVGADSTRNVTFHKPGDYVLNIHDSGCTFQDSISIFLQPRHRSVLSSNILACKDSTLKIPSLVSGAVWHWQGKQTTTDTFRFIPDQSGKLILNTRLTCPQVDTIAVEVRYCQRPNITFFIPTAFSPDANGLNDVYLPVIHEMRLEKMTVFNRWGQKIYEGNSGWDGTFNREKCHEGVYMVSMIYRHMYAPEEPLLIIRANVTLIR